MWFPSTKNEIMEIVSATIFRMMEWTKKVTDAIIESELGY